MTDTLTHKINVRQAALQELESTTQRLKDELQRLEMKRLVVEAELRAYEDVAATLPVRTRRSRRDTDRPLQRRLSQTWTFILRGLGRAYPDTLNGEQIREVAEAGGYDVTPENVRSQMALYVNKGLVERTGPGEYRLTQIGAEELNITLDRKAPGEEPSASQVEGEAGLPAGPSKLVPTGPTPVSSTAATPSGGLDDEIPF